ncbi:hypothetical protein THIOM_003447, partial [Candidatus Thiomargarita nelsonii]
MSLFRAMNRCVGRTLHSLKKPHQKENFNYEWQGLLEQRLNAEKGFCTSQVFDKYWEH